MDKRYQVFVSSTYEDLKEERQEVIQALLELDCIPSGMELFPAADEDQWSLIQRVIDDCDYYIVIIGGRYGSISPSGSSYTQMEYEYAVSTGKPIIGFLHKDPGQIQASKTEQDEQGKIKLNEFRKLVQQKMCKFWSSPAELGSAVSRSVVQLIKRRPAVGWVKASLVPDETSSDEILKLKNRIEELESSLEKAILQGPEGTENLAQGDDKLTINYVGTVFVDGDPTDTFEDVCETTWDELFAFIAPSLVHELSNSTLKSLLDSFIGSKNAKSHDDYDAPLSYQYCRHFFL